MDDRTKLLIDILNDANASLTERDDAAIVYGDSDDGTSATRSWHLPSPPGVSELAPSITD